MDAPATSLATSPADAAAGLVAASGSYELLKTRLSAQGDALRQKSQVLNDARLAQFGRAEQALVLRTLARTENNCVARDIVRIGDQLLFGYNVFIGLRKETAVGDVFGLYRLASREGAQDLESVPLPGSFLEDARFASDFKELYAYYKNAQLIQLRVVPGKLLAAFQIGQQLHDLRVFRWQVDADGTIHYLDNRGERDIALPPSHDFEWTATTREDHVGGKHPHVNILDTVFVETVGGDLTIKVENNTESGRGIYSEPVEDANQSLADAEIAYAKLGLLVLLRVKPYRELSTRYLVFNIRTQQVERIDAIGESCVQLPEDHGIVFPGGYYLQSGEFKRFDLPADVADNLRFKRMLRSPNGEDVLYVFYRPGSGHYALFTYNLIDKTLAAPLFANGYAMFSDGRVLVFQAGASEPARMHPMQLWQTAFASEEHAGAARAGTGLFARIGNADLVRGISDLMGISRAVREQVATRAAYEDLIRQCTRVSDAYFWLDEAEAGEPLKELREIGDTARGTLAEFEKVDQIRRETAKALEEGEARQKALMVEIAATLWRRPEDFISALGRLRERRGHLETLKELRYTDLARIESMNNALAAEQQRVGERAMQFLGDDKAFANHQQSLVKLAADLQTASTSQGLAIVLEALDETAAGLDLLAEQLGGLPGGDAVLRTGILDRISALYTEINRLRADARNRRKAMGSREAAAEFGAQFKLFGQAVDNALDFADSPEKCDEALTRLLAQLEELEGRFAEQDTFLADIAAKREAVYEALTARKQSLAQARQQRVQGLMDAAGRILDGAQRRTAQFSALEEVHSYFAADMLIAKLRNLIGDLRAVKAQVQADDVDTRLKTCRDQALRAVRDRRELVSEDGDTLRLGRHLFTIGRQPLDLTLAPQGESLAFHITSTDYMVPAADARLDALKAWWHQALPSETPQMARAEYLAGCMLDAAQQGQDALDWSLLQEQAAQRDEGHAGLLLQARAFAGQRYQEGYEKGVHDEDAARILAALVRMRDAAGLLAWGPAERALALLYWQDGRFGGERETLQRRARAAIQVQQLFGATDELKQLETECANALSDFAAAIAFEPPGATAVDGMGGPASALCAQAAAYLVRELASEGGAEVWCISGAGEDLAAALLRELERGGQLAAWQRDIEASTPAERWRLARGWVAAFAAAREPQALAWADDAAGLLAVPVKRQRVNAELDHEVSGLRSEHPRIVEGKLALNLNDFGRRFAEHRQGVVPGFAAMQRLRHELITSEKARLKLGQFQARPLSTFVRNRLIHDTYLPLVGDNLAKQIGTAGEGNRTDRMGLLLLISPPGYGKTTLLEYVADRLGLVFVRINCPALGHAVTSIDPASATNSAARQELEKINLALAMGSNVMLYLDDIQHTSAEFLQKFIGLADGTRRIEGTWEGEGRTYDLRGKRFAIAMAGNPYTESGDVFKIPDMLANRSDIYNLGDVLGGQQALFSLSYIENSLTSNAALQPLASRDPADVYRLVQLAQGEDVAGGSFTHGYSQAELEELKALLQRLFRARDLLLKVNLAYIESAAQRDAYRTEPPFKLQGSYRNMAKLAGKITPLMTDAELDGLLRDHYRGEAQTLTTGAQENLLKLAQLMGSATPEESERWRTICGEFVRQRKAGGEDADGSTRVANALLDISRAVDELKPGPSEADPAMQMADAVLQLAVTYRKIIMPLINATEKRLDLDKSIRDRIDQLMAKQLDPRTIRTAPAAAPAKKDT
ncbi:DNA repair ATPase [Ramlibacter sp. WS9]|uniref:DNA repair ATPase n=1 Tax=Ramlibacter sp. WS9 TaxID=1882741 RepID=UPI0011411671|nr:DNA repair ATPase [Ramlibacter sp. WS9]ROZ79037.1 AAA family ATPase [Ramlibacter sp. WS9]